MRSHFALANIFSKAPLGPMSATDDADTSRRRFKVVVRTRISRTTDISHHGVLLPHWSCDLHRPFSGNCNKYNTSYRNHTTASTTHHGHTTSPHSTRSFARFANHTPNLRQSNALSQHRKISIHGIHLLTSLSAPSLARPTRSPVVPSSRPVCTYIYQATECELAPLMSQISNVHPATLS
jgi:hypothetical protein